MRFTFKTHKPVGGYRSFDKPSHYIKLRGKTVGLILPDQPHKIRLQVIKDDINSDGHPNCEWRWIQLRQESVSVEAAKRWLNDVINQIMSKYKLIG